MPATRDPLSVLYDGVVRQAAVRAARLSRERRGVLLHIASPRAEFRRLDKGGRTAHERAFTRAAYYLIFKAPINAGQVPVWSLKLDWADDLAASSAGRLARPVVFRLYPRGSARMTKPRWDDGSGFRSEVNRRVDD